MESMRRVSRRVTAIALGFATITALAPRAARAGDAAVAEQLFLEGKQAMERQDYELACARFKASHDVDPATGTLLNLAVCHERQHKNASAWAEYRQVLAESEGRNPDRAAMARESADRLTSKLSYVTLSISPPATDAVVALDEAKLPPASLGVRIPVDPGPHVLTVSRSGETVVRHSIVVQETQADQKVTLDVPPPNASASPSPSTPPPARTNEGEPPATSSRPTLAYVVGGAGLLVLAGGVTTGAFALSKNGSANHACDGTGADLDGAGHCYAGTPTASRAANDKSDARTLAVASDILVPVGAIALAVGVYIFIAAPSADSKRSAWIAPSLDGAMLGGSF
jgi:hypothetical protein